MLLLLLLLQFVARCDAAMNCINKMIVLALGDDSRAVVMVVC